MRRGRATESPRARGTRRTRLPCTARGRCTRGNDPGGRTVRAGRRGPRAAGPRPAGDSPLAVLGRRFASGEIDEDEYWRRLSVLDEQFGGHGGR
ncbi:SHOCT domain-containing protein [Streptomyces sp. NPDC088766]|uniref:SHOCT domain-containing protein n=1 Tax=Streptomyces sp. NPDC088766 TaxID=3365893 RepID=UPI0038023C83